MVRTEEAQAPCAASFVRVLRTHLRGVLAGPGRAGLIPCRTTVQTEKNLTTINGPPDRPGPLSKTPVQQQGDQTYTMRTGRDSSKTPVSLDCALDGVLTTTLTKGAGSVTGAVRCKSVAWFAHRLRSRQCRGCVARTKSGEKSGVSGFGGGRGFAVVSGTRSSSRNSDSE